MRGVRSTRWMGPPCTGRHLSLSRSLKSINLRDHETLPRKRLVVSATLPLLAWPCFAERGWSLGDGVRVVHECMQLQVEEASCVQICNDRKTLLHVLFTK